MALINKLPNSNLGLKGTTPDKFGDTADQSRLHYEYSLNGRPNLPGNPNPSQLDLNGKIPFNNYKDNAPEGQGGRI